MARKSKFDELEERLDKPIGVILVEKLNELKSVERVAVDIDISTRHVIRKMDKLGIIKSSAWTLPERDHAV